MKIDNLTYKSKNILLAVVFLLLLGSTYYLSVDPTIEMIKAVNTLNDEMRKAENAPIRIARLNEQMTEWDENINAAENGNELHLLIFDEISKVSESTGVQVLGNRCLSSRVDKGITVDTYETTLSGDFKSLEKTLFQMEQNMKYGFVSSVSFELIKNKRDGKDELNLKIIIQTMINN